MFFVTPKTGWGTSTGYIILDLVKSKFEHNFILGYQKTCEWYIYFKIADCQQCKYHLGIGWFLSKQQNLCEDLLILTHNSDFYGFSFSG